VVFHIPAGLLRFLRTSHVLEIGSAVVVALLARRFGIAWLRRLTRKTETDLDDELVSLLDRALVPALGIGVLATCLNLFPLPPKFLLVANRIFFLCTLALALYYGMKVVILTANRWLERKSTNPRSREGVQFVVRVVFASLGTMLLLDNLGISLTAVWTTLGVGSVAVALALQDTLSNFFAGIYIHIDSPVRVGDYVKLDDQHEGFVESLGWRSTHIRMLANNIIVVPNAKLASSVITNYSMPEPAMSLLVSISVSYSADPETVENILVEEAKAAAGHVEGLVADPAPFVRFIPGFGESSLDFTLICRVNTFVDQYLVQHELRKRIFARFRREGIEIPFPQRDVHVHTYQAGAAS
jgi:small-conductance mechanosensitive channel